MRHRKHSQFASTWWLICLMAANLVICISLYVSITFFGRPQGAEERRQILEVVRNSRLSIHANMQSINDLRTSVDLLSDKVDQIHQRQMMNEINIQTNRDILKQVSKTVPTTQPLTVPDIKQPETH